MLELFKGERRVFGFLLLGKPSLDSTNQGKVHWKFCGPLQSKQVTCHESATSHKRFQDDKIFAILTRATVRHDTKATKPTEKSRLPAWACLPTSQSPRSSC